MKRTISVKLQVTPQQSQLLSDLQETFSHVCNEIAEKAWEKKESNRVRLHHLAYRSVRAEFPQLGSQMACNAIAKVAQNFTAIKRSRKIVFKRHSSVHFDKRTYSLKNAILSLYTLNKRIQIPFEPGTFQQAYLEKGVVKEAELIRRGKNWFFNVVLDLPDPVPLEKGKAMAVDFGENVIAATSSGKLIQGGTLRCRRDAFLAHRSRLQRNGSQSAKRRLRKVSGREARHVRHTNHCVAKAIVSEAKKLGCSTIVLEDLTNIRKRIRAGKRTRSRLHRWPFSQLRSFVEYKAHAEGIAVSYVNPAYTSKTCSKCFSLGHRQKHLFECPCCGSRAHADLNASHNLLWLALSAERATGTVNYQYVAASCGQQSFRL